MKSNPDQIKQTLEQVLRSFPDDRQLSDARSHVVAAINLIEHQQKKQKRQQSTNENAKKIQEREAAAKDLGYNPWQMSLPQAQLALKNLDRMIEQENMKIEQMRQSRLRPKSPGTNPDGIDTILTD